MGHRVRVGRRQNAAYAQSIEEQIAAVAEKHRPDGGYGDTAWNKSTRTVFWNAADWSTNDEVAAAEKEFLSIDGVERFESDAEVGMDPYESGDWVIVASAAPEDEDYLALLKLARSPLPELTPEDFGKYRHTPPS